LPRPYPSFTEKFNTIEEILEYILTSVIIPLESMDTKMEISTSLSGGGSIKKMNEKLISSLTMEDSIKSSYKIKSSKSETTQNIKTHKFKQKINFSLKKKYDQTISKKLEEFVMNEDKLYFDSVLL